MNATGATTRRAATPVGDGDEAGSPAVPQKMQAIVQAEYGSADVLRHAQIDKPEISANKVLVKVRAAGLDRGTWHYMTGLPYLARLAFGLRVPKNPVLGLDVAGTVAAVGSKVTRFQPGDEVFGVARGSFAEYAAAREDKLAPKPAGLSFEQAAVVPVSASTALQGLRDAGRVEAGQKVLIVGASGGVGTYAVQLAKAFGTDVTGVCSTAKVDLVRAIGADHVLDYTREDFADGSHSYDLIIDIGGNSRVARLRRALTPKGTLVILGGEEGGRLTGMSRQMGALALSPFVGQRLTTFIAKENLADLATLSQLIGAGELTPIIDKTYPLDQAPDAMRHLEAGRVRGKVAISVGPGEGQR